MSKRKYHVSKHGKDRVRQRTSYYKSSDINSLFNRAIRYGKSPTFFQPPFSDFLKTKLRRGIQVKVYQGMIFIYKGTILITSYSIPDKYKKQIDMDRKKKSIRSTFVGVHTKKLKNMLIHSYDMMISMCQISLCIDVQYEEEYYNELLSYAEEIYSIADEFKSRLHFTNQKEYIYLDNDNIIRICKEQLDMFKEMFNYVETKHMTKLRYKNLEVCIYNICKTIDFMLKSKFFMKEGI